MRVICSRGLGFRVLQGGLRLGFRTKGLGFRVWVAWVQREDGQGRGGACCLLSSMHSTPLANQQLVDRGLACMRACRGISIHSPTHPPTNPTHSQLSTLTSLSLLGPRHPPSFPPFSHHFFTAPKSGTQPPRSLIVAAAPWCAACCIGAHHQHQKVRTGMQRWCDPGSRFYSWATCPWKTLCRRPAGRMER